MIVEVAQIEIQAGMEAEFERGVAAARPVFLAAQGCTGLKLWRSLEQPMRYRLIVEWTTLEDHMITFRESAGFQQWRALVSHCFAIPPVVEHQTTVSLT